MQNELLTQLQRIANLRQFEKDEYICSEGQPGREMYIILKGTVGVYLTSSMGTLSEISRIRQGDFFGEMAIFDDLPRSATCIALEDTSCAAIDKSNIKAFLVNCPELAERMLVTMSLRIRHLDNELYKSLHMAKKRRIPPFALPEAFSMGHGLEEPAQDPQYLRSYRQSCPVCGKDVRFSQFRRNILHVRRVGMDCRIEYHGCEPLWHDVIGCPHCHYANHYLSFFRIHPMNLDQVRQLVKEQHAPVAQQAIAQGAQLDQLMVRYLQAIHLNEAINSGDSALIGSLWMNLYWLSKDAGDQAFAGHCAQKAAARFAEALDGNQVADPVSRSSIALSLTALLVQMGRKEEALKYCGIAVTCPDVRVMNAAFTLKERLTL